MIVLTDEEDEDFNLEALTEATVISCLGVAIIVSNVVIIATFLNARGKKDGVDRDGRPMETFSTGGHRF